jgi:hypothetical protein
MRLRLYFSGMHLFVPVREPDPSPRVHVVMPKSVGHHAPEQHIPMLAVNADHLVANTPRGGRGWYTYPLRGRVLTVEEHGALDTRICPEILDLRDVTNRTVDPDVLGANAHENVVARVDLFAGRMSSVERGACWYWSSPAPRPAAHVAEWEVQWPMDYVELTLTDFAGIPQVTLPPLYPLRDTDVVEVSILHLPPAALPREEEEEVHPPPQLSEAPHFGCYFFLLNGYGYEGRPRFALPPSKCAPIPMPCPAIVHSGGSPYNCMLATFSPPPGG